MVEQKQLFNYMQPSLNTTRIGRDTDILIQQCANKGGFKPLHICTLKKKKKAKGHGDNYEESSVSKIKTVNKLN